MKTGDPILSAVLEIDREDRLHARHAGSALSARAISVLAKLLFDETLAGTCSLEACSHMACEMTKAKLARYFVSVFGAARQAEKGLLARPGCGPKTAAEILAWMRYREASSQRKS